MIEAYVSPRLEASTAELAVVDEEWVATIVAAALGIAVAIVIAVCTSCGAMSSVSGCYNTMKRWLTTGSGC
jgi:hypothetical protein